jgi:hypothetical protein
MTSQKDTSMVRPSSVRFSTAPTGQLLLSFSDHLDHDHTIMATAASLGNKMT